MLVLISAIAQKHNIVLFLNEFFTELKILFCKFAVCNFGGKNTSQNDR